MPKFIPYDPNQSKMVVINYADQLQPGTFEFAINHIIDNKLGCGVSSHIHIEKGDRFIFDSNSGDSILILISHSCVALMVYSVDDIEIGILTPEFGCNR